MCFNISIVERQSYVYIVMQIAQQDLEDMFSKFGRLERCELIIDPVTRESRYVNGWTVV